MLMGIRSLAAYLQLQVVWVYQYYKFERLDGYLQAKARQALRSISSRAEISATSFQVYYTYSDLRTGGIFCTSKSIDTITVFCH